MGTILSLILTSITAPHLMFYPGAQPCGMAGAYVAVAENSWACFYNPAGLGTLTQRSVGAELRHHTFIGHGSLLVVCGCCTVCARAGGRHIRFRDAGAGEFVLSPIIPA